MSGVKTPRDPATPGQPMSCIFDSEVMASGKLTVSLSFDASPDGGFSPGLAFEGM
jgi:hypothetical protein